jgi:crotonobetainyl-CoA:carnitine CoA-transferase CaiB-like acyl-CoA transferase
MADNLFAFQYWGLGNGFACNQWPAPGTGLTVGGTPRYQIYRTSDNRYLACAPLEQPFWENFLRVLEAPDLLDDAQRPDEVRKAVASIIATRTASEWVQRFMGIDACVSLVKSLEEGAASPQFAERGLFKRTLDSGDGQQIPALPTPIDGRFRQVEGGTAPTLGEGNQGLL